MCRIMENFIENTDNELKGLDIQLKYGTDFIDQYIAVVAYGLAELLENGEIPLSAAKMYLYDRHFEEMFAHNPELRRAVGLGDELDEEYFARNAEYRKKCLEGINNSPITYKLVKYDERSYMFCPPQRKNVAEKHNTDEEEEH